MLCSPPIAIARLHKQAADSHPPIHTSMTYVEIIRRFHEDKEEDATRTATSDKSLTWNGLVGEGAIEATVLVAASGSGKSTEFSHQVPRMRAAGQHAFLVTASAMANEGIEAGMSAEEHCAFANWRETADSAHLFIDAIDELHLHRRELQDVLRKLERGIDLRTRSLQLVLSARTGAWSVHHTALLSECFKRSGRTDPKVRVVGFHPLDHAAIGALASAYQVADLGQFMADFDRDEVGSLLEPRPRDIQILVRQWNHVRRFGRWSQLLKDFVTNALEPDGSDRERHRLLSVEQGRQGVRRLGAALVLGKRTFVAPPTIPSSDAISARRLFEDWTTDKAIELFERSLFVHKGRDAQYVQLVTGTLAPFLAAEWFADRVRRGLSDTQLKQTIMVRVFGEAEFQLPQSRRQLAGWIASEVPEFRKHLLPQWPEVLLFEGDPDRLSDRDIADGLQALSVKLQSGSRAPSASDGTIRKLARPGLEPLILSILSTRPTNESLWLALRFVEFGQYASCYPYARNLAIDTTVKEHLRAAAIAAVARAGNPSDRTLLHQLVNDASEHVRCQLLRLLYNDLDEQTLISLLTAGGGFEFRYTAHRMIGNISTSTLDAVLQSLVPTLQRTEIDSRTKPAIASALVVATERIGRADVPPVVLDAIIAVETLAERSHFFVSNDDTDKLRAAVRNNLKARQQLWMKYLACSRYVSSLTDPPSADDLEWLTEEWQRATGGDQPFIVSTIHYAIVSSGDRKQQVFEQLPQELKHAVQLLEDQAESSQRKRAAYEVKRANQKNKDRRDSIANLLPHKSDIEAGDHVNALVWAWQQLGDQHPQRARRDLSRLKEAIGDELAVSVTRGFIARWRKQEVPVPDPTDNGIWLVGLTGLTLEVLDGLDFSSLRPEEANLAARYALYELNGFPFWFEDLLAAHPHEVETVLRSAVSLEWDMNAERTSILRFAPYSPRTIAFLMRRIVLDLASRAAPRSRQVLENAVDTLLLNGENLSNLRGIANAGILTDAANDERLLQWLRLLTHVDPLGAADALENMRAADSQRHRHLLEMFASAIDEDLSERHRSTLFTAMTSPRALGRWTRILYEGIAPEDDVIHESGHPYSPGSRDNAQELRDRCLTLLARDASVEAHEILRSLQAEPSLARYTGMLADAIDRQRTLAIEQEARARTEDDVVAAERADERPPATLDDLFSMVRAHLQHLDGLISDADFGYGDLFDPTTTTTKEREIQLWAASCLRERARGLYSVVRENMVADDKEVDISAVAGVGQLPIEIKPLGRYSYAALKKVIENQLLKQYMLPTERKFGVLLLVRREKKTWRINNRAVNLKELVEALQADARAIASRAGKVIAVEVIDLRPSHS